MTNTQDQIGKAIVISILKTPIFFHQNLKKKKKAKFRSSNRSIFVWPFNSSAVLVGYIYHQSENVI